MKLERQEHKQFKHNLEREAREQTDLKEKVVQESNSKLESLQQHYKLLKSQHDDYTEECSKVKAKQLEEINALQRKVKSLQSQNSQSVKEKDKDIELWKVKKNKFFYWIQHKDNNYFFADKVQSAVIREATAGKIFRQAWFNGNSSSQAANKRVRIALFMAPATNNRWSNAGDIKQRSDISFDQTEHWQKFQCSNCSEWPFIQNTDNIQK